MNVLNLNKEAKYLLGCSFGPDSMALFYMLISQGYKFDVAIVNYHLRKESDFEVHSLHDYCDKNNIKLHVLDVKDKITKNIEATCRKIRYDFFATLVSSYGYESVLIAQHQDDLIETYLMQKSRQNLPNYYGISEKSIICGVNVIRPLLKKSKLELLEICNKNNIPYSIDKSNFDTSILRNKIRHEIVANFSKDERQEILREIEIKNNEFQTIKNHLDIDRLNSVNYILSRSEKEQKIALNILVKNLDESISLSKENVGEIIKLLKSKKPNIFTKIKKNLFVVKEYDTYFFTTSSETSIEYEYVLDKPGLLDTPYFYLDFSKDSSDRNVCIDDYPIKIRNISKEDKYKIDSYTVDATRLMIDWKVPAGLRKIWPVILNKNNEIIYIPRYQKSFNNFETNFFVKTNR